MITPASPSLGHFPTAKQAIALRDGSRQGSGRMRAVKRNASGHHPVVIDNTLLTE